jgi:fructokinase
VSSRSSLGVVTFGEVLWDVFEIAPDTYRRVIGGAPANLAVVLARLGVRASVIGAVGADAFGEALAARLSAEGVGTASLLRLPHRTGLAFVQRGRRGEPSFLFYRHETADMMLRREHLAPKMLRATFAVCGTSTLVDEGLRRATLRFAELAKRAGASLVVDLNVRAHLWHDARVMRRRIAELVERAAMIKASTADLAALGGSAFLRIHGKSATVFTTAGSGWAQASGTHGTVERAASRTRCVDATGAGDAFLGGALAVLVARRATPGSAAWTDPAVFSDALEVGHMLGAKAVSKVGAVTGVVGLRRAIGIIR